MKYGRILNRLDRTLRQMILLISTVAFVLSAAGASQCEEWRTLMAGIDPRGYVCRFTPDPVTIDGKLDDPAWEEAPWTADFVDIQGPGKPAPRFRTRAKMVWDREFLYVAAELEEPDVWATLTNHDSVIFQDPDFEMFIDPDGDTHNYYEFEINALNTGWDLLLDKPYQDGGKARNEWEIPGLKTGAEVRGTLNKPGDKDTGWTLELALPWKVLGEHARHAGPPREGEEWRINFSRVEWDVKNGGNKYEKVANRPEHNWVWSPQGIIDMHRPEMWGRVEFKREEDGPRGVHEVQPLPGKAARSVALELYYAQRDFREVHSRWATNLVELGWAPANVAQGIEAPVLQLSPDGYTCTVGFKTDEGARAWSIRQDRLLKLQ